MTVHPSTDPRREQVYLIGSPDSPVVKIGCSTDPKRRLRNLQSGSPAPLRLLATFEGGYVAEKELHRRFAGRRVHGEWFDLGPNPVETVSPFVKAAQVEEAERAGLHQPKHVLRYDHLSIEEWSQWFPDDPPSVYERVERECATWREAGRCLCVN